MGTSHIIARAITSQPIPHFKLDTVLGEQYYITIEPTQLSSSLSNRLMLSNVFAC